MTAHPTPLTAGDEAGREIAHSGSVLARGPVRRLCDSITVDPEAPRQLAVVGPGGHGKTAVLGEIAAAYRRAGMLVVNTADAVVDLAGREPVALIVDDVQRLGDTQLAQLCELAEVGHPALVVAHRPHPTLTSLTTVLGRHGPALVLAALDHEQTAVLMATARGAAAPPELVDFVHAQTGGVPRFVDRLATITRRAVPDPALLTFRHDLDQLDDQVLRFLLALEAGAGRHVELLADLLTRPGQHQRTCTAGPGDDPRLVLAGPQLAHELVASVMLSARATGLVGEDGALLPITRRAMAALVPAERRVAVRQRLARSQLDAGGPVLGLASGLVDAGLAGPGMAAVFLAAATEAAPDRPALATRCYAAAAAAGAPLPALTIPWADAWPTEP